MKDNIEKAKALLALTELGYSRTSVIHWLDRAPDEKQAAELCEGFVQAQRTQTQEVGE